MSRLGRAGEDPPRFRALVLARERRAEVPRFQRQFWDLLGPIRSGASRLAGNVVGWHGQEPSRFELAAPEQGCQAWQLEGGRPKHRPPVWAFCILVQGLLVGQLHPHSRPELGSCSCDVPLGSGGQVFSNFQLLHPERA